MNPVAVGPRGHVLFSPVSCTIEQDTHNPQMGFRSGPPDSTTQPTTFSRMQTGSPGSLTITNRAKSCSNHRLILGVDRVAENNADMTPRNDVLGNTYASFSSTTSPTNGSISIRTRDLTTSHSITSRTCHQPHVITDRRDVRGGQFTDASRVCALQAQQLSAAGLPSIPVGGHSHGWNLTPSTKTTPSAGSCGAVVWNKSPVSDRRHSHR